MFKLNNDKGSFAVYRFVPKIYLILIPLVFCYVTALSEQKNIGQIADYQLTATVSFGQYQRDYAGWLGKYFGSHFLLGIKMEQTEIDFYAFSTSPSAKINTNTSGKALIVRIIGPEKSFFYIEGALVNRDWNIQIEENIEKYEYSGSNDLYKVDYEIPSNANCFAVGADYPVNPSSSQGSFITIGFRKCISKSAKISSLELIPISGQNTIDDAREDAERHLKIINAIVEQDAVMSMGLGWYW